MSAVLCSWRIKDTGLAAALAKVPKSWLASAPSAILYSRERCLLGVVAQADESVELRGPDGTPLPLGAVYEARCFCKAGELRWQGDVAGVGVAVFLAEDRPVFEGDVWAEDALALTEFESRDDAYLLAGQGLEGPCPAGWSRLGTAAIGALDIPLAGVLGQARAWLWFREYFAPAPGDLGTKHGNVEVAEERLLGFSLAKPEVQ